MWFLQRLLTRRRSTCATIPAVPDDQRLTGKDWKLFYLSFINSLATGVIAGLALLFAQRWLTTPAVRYSTDSSKPQEVNVSINNDSSVPAYAVTGSVRFDRPVSRHEQSSGAFTVAGKPLEGPGLLAGRNEVNFRCDLLPPGTSYHIRFFFSESLGAKPEVKVSSAVGPADED
jgi:hypothetical protein